eukprot:8482278-Pyramimonas_sp.AAC.1
MVVVALATSCTFGPCPLSRISRGLRHPTFRQTDRLRDRASAMHCALAQLTACPPSTPRKRWESGWSCQNGARAQVA